jgi:2-polyprenyl-3-methyl-5-hydroxy-6-metoxy-1,4-benzoquinol methylase
MSDRPAIEYRDDDDHFTNGVLRLLGLDRAEFDRWIELSEAEDAELLDALAAGWAALRPAPPAPYGARLDAPVARGPGDREGSLWHAAIGENPGVGFARSENEGWAWLVEWNGSGWAKVDRPPVYEEEYFEGAREKGGYGAYSEEAKWRLEKAARQVREMRAATGLDSGRVLDVGSGYGYFRVALAEAGFEHEGLEVSEHGRQVARRSFGQDTHAGELEDHWRDWQGRFDVLTAFDLIEHVADPTDFLSKARHALAPGGFVGLKTPNIDVPEAQVFGPHYHSLKREHLVLFSPQSLSETARDAGLEPVEVTTVSHLLRGFVGDDVCREWERDGRGADIVAWYRAPA